MLEKDSAVHGPHFGPFASVRHNVVKWLLTHGDPAKRAVEAQIMCELAELNLREYRRVRNEAVREWQAATNAKPAHIAAVLKLGKSSVHNILNGVE